VPVLVTPPLKVAAKDGRIWPCAPRARIICGGRFHPENCRLIR
jgi:hypothetical protein